MEKRRKKRLGREDWIRAAFEILYEAGMAKYDLAIWHWAQSDATAQTVFRRTLEKRFEFAAWMFRQVGFNKIQAETRARMMVVYMMGESTLIPDTLSTRRKRLKLKHEILTAGR